MKGPPNLSSGLLLDADNQLLTGSHEAIPRGVPGGYSWRLGPAVSMGTNPQQAVAGYPPSIREWRALLPWWIVYFEDGVANTVAPNTCVEIVGMETFLLRRSTQRWELLQAGTTPAGEFGAYREDFTGTGGATLSHSSFGADGVLRIRPGPNSAGHGWTTRLATPWAADGPDIEAILVSVTHRLGLIDGGGTDDRASARFLVGSGADYWPSLTATLATIAPMTVLPGLGTGRLRRSRIQPTRSYFLASGTVDPTQVPFLLPTNY